MAGGVQLTMEMLCDGLDQLCIQQLELMDQLIKANMMLEERMRGGFWMLGKTRYSLGTHAISALQLPSSDCQVARLAEVTSEPVTLGGYDGDVMYHRVEARFGDPSIQQENGESDEYVMKEKEEKDIDSDQQLRRRLAPYEGNQQVDELNSIEDEYRDNPSGDTVKSKPKILSGNPIRWFTALPPQTLRQAQTEFKSAVCLAAECASTQLKLRAVSKEFRRLKEIKNKLDYVEKET